MSKFIPNKENKQNKYQGQVKPKLKIKVSTPDGKEQIFDEYTLAAMLSEQIVRINNLEQQMKALLDGMASVTEQPEKGTLNLPTVSDLKIPKLES